MRGLLHICVILGCGLALFGAEPATSYTVIVHRSNPVQQLRETELKELLSGATLYWPNHAKVVLAQRDVQSAPFEFLTRRILNVTPGEYRRRLMNLEFAGQDTVPVKTLNSDAAACRFVFNVPGALSIIESRSLLEPACRDARVVKVEGAAFAGVRR